MSIMWKYLDKRSATIAAIKDYDAMQFIWTSGRLRSQQSRTTTPCSSS